MKYSLFIWRFRCRRRTACVSSLLNSLKFLMFKVKCYCFVRTCPIISQNVKCLSAKQTLTTSENFFSGFNICCGRNQKTQRLTYTILSVFALKRYGGAWTERRPDKIKVFILQIQLRIIFPRYTLIRIIFLNQYLSRGTQFSRAKWNPE